MFAIHDSAGGFEPAVVDDLLNDRLAFCVFRGALAAADCAGLADAFHASAAVRSRGDQVPGRTLGTGHYLKTAPQYLRDSALAIDELQTFFAARHNPVDGLLRQLAEHLGRRGCALRTGRFGSQSFCPMVMRSWAGTGEFSLLPHEDISQLGFPPQAALEFAAAAPTVGNINVCLTNYGEAVEQGAVRLWNFCPDADERQRLGIGTSGYPYPMAALAHSSWVQVPIFAGDIYVINGRYVHAVTGGDTGGRRVTLAAMLAFTDPATCIHWS